MPAAAARAGVDLASADEEPITRLLRDELEIAMALCGCATLADIEPSLLDGSN